MYLVLLTNRRSSSQGMPHGTGFTRSIDTNVFGCGIWLCETETKRERKKKRLIYSQMEQPFTFVIHWKIVTKSPNLKKDTFLSRNHDFYSFSSIHRMPFESSNGQEKQREREKKLTHKRISSNISINMNFWHTSDEDPFHKCHQKSTEVRSLRPNVLSKIKNIQITVYLWPIVSLRPA